MYLVLKDNGIYFKEEELKKEIDKKENIILNSKEEILELIKDFKSFTLIGIPSKELLINIDIMEEEPIYIVKLINNKFCFCNSKGRVLNIKI